MSIRKFTISFVLLFVLISGMTIPAMADNTYFNDVVPGDWYYQDVTQMATRGFVGGFNQFFSPNKEISVGEYDTILCRMTGLDISSVAIPKGYHWSAGAVKLVSDILGPGDPDYIDWTGTESCSAAITRESAVRVGLKVFGLKDPVPLDRMSNPFTDIGEEPYDYAAYAVTAYHLGVVSGSGREAFRPKDHLSRAAACKILLNMEDANLYVLNTVDIVWKDTSYDVISLQAACDGLALYPMEWLETYAQGGCQIVITSKPLDMGWPAGLYSVDSGDIEVRHDINTPDYTAGPIDFLHEFAHWAEDHCLSSEDRKTLSYAYRTEADAVVAALHNYEYARTNESEFFASFTSCYLLPKYKNGYHLGYGQGYDTIVGLVEKVLNTD